MTNIKIFMVCRKNEKRNEIEAKRFWEVQERLFTIPLSEEQIVRAIGGFRMDV